MWTQRDSQAVPSAVFAYDALWQQPARTEKHAFDLAIKLFDNYRSVAYVGFPWASLIDGLNRATEIGAVLDQQLALLAPPNGFERVVTVCQHIKFRHFIDHFKRAGVTDLFASHAFKGEHILAGINIHPFPLFPVQLPKDTVFGMPRDDRLEEFLARPYRFSFIGAHNPEFYLTDSRSWLFDLEGSPESFVLNRAEWHYERRVYKEQIEGEALEAFERKTEEQNAEEFKRVLAQTRFAPCPSGTGPNSIRLWEAIEFGCIPVLLADDLRLPGDPKLWERASVIVPETEQAVRKLPDLLESLESDPQVIADKLVALGELRELYGKDSFIADVRTLADFVESAANVTSGPARVHTHHVYLSIAEADDEAVLEWLWLLLVLADATGVNPVVYLGRRSVDTIDLDAWPLNGLDVRTVDHEFTLLHDWRKDDLAIIGDSSLLSHNLLRDFSHLWIRAKRRPKKINPSLHDVLTRYLEGNSPLALARNRFEGSATRARVLDSLREWRPICSLVTSMFNGDEYLEPFLENSAALEQYDTIEHLIARPNSPGREHLRLLQHVDDHDGAVYIWLSEDPGLYEVWNALCRLSTGPYLSNFNIDDRRAPAQVTTLVERLERAPDLEVASAALRISMTKNMPWRDSDDCPTWYEGQDIERYEASDLVTRRDGRTVPHNMPHCMPIWRRSLHVSNGFFDEARFGPSADWEFWLRSGKDGAGLTLVGQALGLYLKTEDSYWRRSEHTSTHDRHIIETYTDPSGEYRVPDDRRPFALRIDEMLLARRQGQVARYLWCLLELHRAARPRYPEQPELERLVNRALTEDFGIGDPDLAERGSLCCEPVEGLPKRFVSLAWLLVDVLHERPPDEWPVRRRALDNIRRVTGELRLTTDGTELNLIEACICRLQGDTAGEMHFLRKAYRRSSNRFWTALQAAYRFTVPLEEICGLLGDLPPFYHFEDLEDEQTLYFLPDYTHGNPYQKLLYGGLAGTGVKTQGIARLVDLGEEIPDPQPRDVVHVHWINYLYKGLEPHEYAGAIDAFLARLEELKRKGVRIFWTVHNRYSHDLPDIDLERRFRRRLCGLADRILIHHPCLLDEIAEWLPHDAPVNFVEHGNYIGEYENAMSRDEARASLGVAPDDIVISIIGQVRPYKDLHRYLPAIREAMEQQPRLKLVLAGRVSCEETAAEIEKMPPGQVIVENRFIKESEFQRFLNAASFVFLSYKDILTSGSLFQALSFKVPVVAPVLGSIPAYLVAGWNGFVYSRPETFEHALSEAIDSTRAASRGLNANAVKTAASAKWPGDLDAVR